VQTISCTKVPGISSCIDYSCQFFVCYRWERRSRPGSMVAWLVCLQELACIDWTVCGSVKLASPRRAQHGRSDVRLPACWRGGDGQQDMAAATGALGGCHAPYFSKERLWQGDNVVCESLPGAAPRLTSAVGNLNWQTSPSASPPVQSTLMLSVHLSKVYLLEHEKSIPCSAYFKQLVCTCGQE
jgi:hypothetical protein